MTQLQALDISRNKVSSLHGLERLSALQMLRASHNQIVSLHPLTGLTALTELSLDSCPVTTVVADGPAADESEGSSTALQQPPAASLPASLRRLSLCRCALPSVAACAPLRLLPRLKHLSLAGNPFSRPERLSAGESCRAAVLASCCPVGLVALDGKPVGAEERALLLQAGRRAALRRAGGAAARAELRRLLVEGSGVGSSGGAAGRRTESEDGGGPGGSSAAAEGGMEAGKGPAAGVEAEASFLFPQPCQPPEYRVLPSLPLFLTGGDQVPGTANTEEAATQEHAAAAAPAPAVAPAASAQPAAAAVAEEDEPPESELLMQPAQEWWRRHFARQSSGGDGAALERTNEEQGDPTQRGGSASPDAGAAARSGRRSASPPRPADRTASCSPGGRDQCDPISVDELEDGYLLSEGILLAARGAARRGPARPARPGIEFDGHSLGLTGGVLRALWSPSYAAVAEVRLSHVAFDPHVSHLVRHDGGWSYLGI